VIRLEIDAPIIESSFIKKNAKIDFMIRETIEMINGI
jgi:hypothetical protein